jgi:hypothetical protein
VQPEVSHDRAQPLGIDVRVARGCCDTLMAQEGLYVAQVGSPLVEQERGGRMPQGMAQTRRPIRLGRLVRTRREVIARNPGGIRPPRPGH